MSDRHTVVGTWRINVEIPGAPPGMVNLATFSLDGGVAVVFASPNPAPPGSGHRLEYWSTAVGRWSATESRQAKMTFVSLGANENGSPIGTHTISATLTADAEGDALTGPFSIVIADQDGKTLAEVSGTVSATRMAA